MVFVSMLPCFIVPLGNGQGFVWADESRPHQLRLIFLQLEIVLYQTRRDIKRNNLNEGKTFYVHDTFRAQAHVERLIYVCKF